MIRIVSRRLLRSVDDSIVFGSPSVVQSQEGVVVYSEADFSVCLAMEEDDVLEEEEIV